MKKLLIIIALLVGVLLVATIGFFVYLEVSIRSALDSSGAVQRTEIPRGIGSGKIGLLLEEGHIIKHRYLFYYYLWRYGRSDRLQAGTYELSPAMTVAEIAQKMMGGAVASDEVRVTTPEGYTSEEVEVVLKKAGFATVDVATEMKTLGITEGMLFPDTYIFKKEAIGATIIKRMYDNFLKKTDPLKSDIAASGHTLNEMLVMASLIEEEMPVPEDRAVVSGILWKRLAAGMPLQVDATVIYAKGIRGGRGTERSLTLADLQIDSHYNTYKYAGLPPHPIANAGLDAIKASLLPTETEYWYYLSKPDGSTVFSKTFEEHVQAKNLYLR